MLIKFLLLLYNQRVNYMDYARLTLLTLKIACKIRQKTHNFYNNV